MVCVTPCVCGISWLAYAVANGTLVIAMAARLACAKLNPWYFLSNYYICVVYFKYHFLWEYSPAFLDLLHIIMEFM